MAGSSDLLNQLRLYVVTDERFDVDTLVFTVQQAILGGASTIQLRRKNEDGRRFVEIGHMLRRITKELGALYIVNDRIDVAVLTEADGVHIGQSDISCPDARRLLGNKLIGVSAGTLEEAIQAEKDGADYLGVGAIYPTPSKQDADICGLQGLSEIAKAVELPVIAIGGITQENTSEILRHGADGVAVVSGVMSAANPKWASEEFLMKLSAR